MFEGLRIHVKYAYTLSIILVTLRLISLSSLLRFVSSLSIILVTLRPLSLMAQPVNQDDTLTKILTGFIGGVITVPTYLALRNKMPSLWTPVLLFGGALFAVLMTSFMGHALRALNFRRCVWESLIAAGSFFAGGIVPLGLGLLVPNRVVRIITLIVMTCLVTALMLVIFRGDGRDRRHTEVPLWCIWLLVNVVIAVQTLIVDFAEKI
ncbi:unnamed protein product [Microthlaspi erraticum]|uniref:Uncharacterized protein n=1 Tax=Microthlaspi erraticum TaxID=1685480 RepID=A0A6D2JDF5_9BRAS|nr:unnamed protein product [Microthlaspi erraticum]